ncbi:hypothetical protein T492DRAFT_839280 [Pavlovales sp. CCMP2436]|nr:hypothetical protein T492DRAFT_839280 [Pavlovales sp. CCMP2436]
MAVLGLVRLVPLVAVYLFLAIPAHTPRAHIGYERLAAGFIPLIPNPAGGKGGFSASPPVVTGQLGSTLMRVWLLKAGETLFKALITVGLYAGVAITWNGEF